MAGIYIHIPFCKTRCTYCDFHSCTNLTPKTTMLEVIEQEIVQRLPRLEGERLETIYIGGGTPSLCTAQEVGRLLARVVGEEVTPNQRLTSVREVTMELNPDDLSPEYLAQLREVGVNRLSIGVQSFVDRDLRWMNRRHTAQQALDAIGWARAAGFDNLSIDLIYGIPAMSLAQWNDNLSQAIDAGVEHISAYHLTIEERTPLGGMLQRGELTPVEETLSRTEFERLQERLQGAGYEAYEVSNFALPGRRALHNSNYWLGIPYLGVGPSAHSFFGSVREENVADNEQYLQQAPLGKHTCVEVLDQRTRFNEYLMTSLRTSDGLDINELETRFGARKLQHFQRQASRFLQNGTLIYTQDRCSIPTAHFFISDGIISDLFLLEDV